MSIDNFIKKLQNQPYKTRVRILWSSVVIIGLALIILWVVNLKTTISGITGNPLAASETKETKNPLTSEVFIKAERTEMGDNGLKILFNVSNPTDDILNFPPLGKITAEDKVKTPAIQITDRQGRPFVQKILSKTQNFGIIIFPKVDSEKIQLDFDQMFFEKTPEKLFRQQIELDLNELLKTDNLRG